jgi:hypothetical protein
MKQEIASCSTADGNHSGLEVLREQKVLLATTTCPRMGLGKRDFTILFSFPTNRAVQLKS